TMDVRRIVRAPHQPEHDPERWVRSHSSAERHYRRPGRRYASRDGRYPPIWPAICDDSVTLGRSVGRRLDPGELLDPPAEADLGSVQITLGVDRDVVDPFELAGLAAVPAPLGQHLAGLAGDGDDLAVGAVGDEDVALLRVLRQHQVPDRAIGKGL